MGDRQDIGQGIGNSGNTGPELVTPIIRPELVITIRKIKRNLALIIRVICDTKITSPRAKHIDRDVHKRITCLFFNCQAKCPSARVQIDDIYLMGINRLCGPVLAPLIVPPELIGPFRKPEVDNPIFICLIMDAQIRTRGCKCIYIDILKGRGAQQHMHLCHAFVYRDGLIRPVKYLRPVLR